MGGSRSLTSSPFLGLKFCWGPLHRAGSPRPGPLSLRGWCSRGGWAAAFPLTSCLSCSRSMGGAWALLWQLSTVLLLARGYWAGGCSSLWSSWGPLEASSPGGGDAYYVLGFFFSYALGAVSSAVPPVLGSCCGAWGPGPVWTPPSLVTFGAGARCPLLADYEGWVVLGGPVPAPFAAGGGCRGVAWALRPSGRGRALRAHRCRPSPSSSGALSWGLLLILETGPFALPGGPAFCRRSSGSCSYFRACSLGYWLASASLGGCLFFFFFFFFFLLGGGLWPSSLPPSWGGWLSLASGSSALGGGGSGCFWR
jgi:hypothetical protein